MSCDRVDNAVFMTNNPSSGWSSPISTGGNPLLYFNIPNVESWYPMILLVILQLVGFRLANDTIPDSSHSISRTWTVSQQTLSELCLREVCKKTCIHLHILPISCSHCYMLWLNTQVSEQNNNHPFRTPDHLFFTGATVGSSPWPCESKSLSYSIILVGF